MITSKDEFEIIFSALRSISEGPGLDDILMQTLRVLVRKLNLKAGVVFAFPKNGEPVASPHILASIPLKIKRNSAYEIAFERATPILENPGKSPDEYICINIDPTLHGYIMGLPQIGLVLFLKAGEKISPNLLWGLKEVNKKWSHSINMFLTRQASAQKQLQAATAIAQAKIEMEKAEELRKVNELFALFMHHSPIYTYIKEVTATESRVLQASDNFRQMVGIPGSEMIGKTMEELFPAEFGAKISADDWAVVSAGHELKLDEDFNGRNYHTIKFPIALGGRNLLAGYTIDITERKQAEEALAERVKELRCLYGISALLELPRISLNEILQRTVMLIPPAWQFSDITEACLELEGQLFQTARFHETPWMQSREITVHGKPVGQLTVCYLEERQPGDEGPFQSEERLLLNAIAERLGHIIERIKAEEEKAKLIFELQNALAEVKKLSGLLPICASCKKIKDDQGYWNQIEMYIRDHSEAEFTHSVCPECAKKLYPEYYDKVWGNEDS